MTQNLRIVQGDSLNGSYLWIGRRWFAWSWVLLITLIGFVGSANTQFSPKERAQAERQKWQARVDGLTKDIVSDSTTVSDCERSLYLALLAKIWWKVDEAAARGYLKLAASKVLSGLRSDAESTMVKDVGLTQRTVGVIATLDPEIAKDLTIQIVAAVDKNTDSERRGERPELAELLASLGRNVVETKPGLALACGVDSLVYGIARTLPELISALNLKDHLMGESLYYHVAEKVVGNYSQPAFLFEINFGHYLFGEFGPKLFSESIRRSYLTGFTDYVAKAAMIESERQTRCPVVTYITPDILANIDQELPERSQTFRGNIQMCVPYVSAQWQESSRSRADLDQPRTVEELVSASKNSHDNFTKLRYWRRALSLLDEGKKYAEMISLLDDVDGDDFKAISPAGWNDWRLGAAYQAVLSSLDAKDLPATYRIIDKTPQLLRPDLRMRIAKKLTPTGNSQFYLDNLDALDKGLGSLEQSDKHAARAYRELAELYLKVRPTESATMFDKAVKYINKTDADNPDFLTEKDWAPFYDYVPLSAELLDFDDISITDSLNNITSRRSRVRVKLGLLESCLKKYVGAKKKLQELIQAVPSDSLPKSNNLKPGI